jgi:hypothetical protein
VARKREPDPPDPPFIPETSQEPDELEQAIAGLPKDFSVITLYRIPDQGKPRYVTKLTPDEFDLEQIKRQYGGGRFRYVAIQEGIQVQKGHFEIEGEPVLPGRREEASPVSRDLAALGDKFDRLADSLTARPVSEDKDKLMAVLMAKLLEQKEDSEEKLLAKLSAYKAVLGGGESSNFTMILEAIKQGMLLSGEGAGASPWVYIMDKLAPSVEKIAGALTRGEPEKKPLAPAPVLQVSDVFRPFISLLKPYLPALIASASVNASAESWADIIQDNIPEQDFASMQTWLRGETWFKDLSELDRRITLQAAWWQTLRSLLLEPPEGEEPGGGEGETAE